MDTAVLRRGRRQPGEPHGGPGGRTDRWTRRTKSGRCPSRVEVGQPMYCRHNSESDPIIIETKGRGQKCICRVNKILSTVIDRHGA